MQIGRSDVLKLVMSPVFVSLGFISIVFIVAGLLGLRFNASPSLPIGIYIVSERETDLIAFCPAEPYATIAAARGYRERGNCPDGAAPLMKPVVARTGDTVEFGPAGLAIDGKLLPNSAPRETDTRGRPLDHWQFGRYAVPRGAVWVASSYSAHSYDSRYFGPVATAAIRDHLRPLLTI